MSKVFPGQTVTFQALASGSNYFSATVGGKPFVFGSYDYHSAPYQVATIFSSVL